MLKNVHFRFLRPLTLSQYDPVFLSILRHFLLRERNRTKKKAKQKAEELCREGKIPTTPTPFTAGLSTITFDF